MVANGASELFHRKVFEEREPMRAAPWGVADSVVAALDRDGCGDICIGK